MSYSNYVLPKNASTTIPNFFHNHTVSEWNFEKFLIDCQTQYNSSYDEAVEIYENSLNKIINLEEVDNYIRLKAEILLLRNKIKPTPNQTVININGTGSAYNNYGTIVNNNNPSDSNSILEEEEEIGHKRPKFNHLEKTRLKIGSGRSGIDM